jgi:sigma-B regulation protein RsbU (phosphoserine phosphatase)
MNILLIEYDYDVQTLLKTFLEIRGHQVVHYEDGESGWAAYQAQSYPLVIVDCSFPGGDGIELCQKIRGTPKGFESMIMVITARTRLGNLGQVLAAGADDYLEKPIDLDHLSIRLAIAELRVNSLNQQATNIESLNENSKLSKETGYNLEIDSIDLALSEVIEMAHKIGINVIAERAGNRRANRLADRRQM